MFDSGLAIDLISEMNASASALSTRFLSVKIAIGRRVLGMATARGRTVEYLLGTASAKPWMKGRKPPVTNSRLRRLCDGVTTVACGGSKPSSRNASAASAVVKLSVGDITHFSSATSASAIRRRRVNGLRAPAATSSSSSNNVSTRSTSSSTRPITRMIPTSIVRSISARWIKGAVPVMMWKTIRGCRRVSRLITASTGPEPSASAHPAPRLTRRRIGEELDVLHALAQLVEHGDASPDDGLAVLRRRDAPGAAFEQPHAERMLEIGDRARDRRLRGAESLRRLSHAASFDH